MQHKPALTRLCVSAEGAKAEKAYAENGTVPDPESTDNPEFKIVLGLIRDGLKKNPTKWTKYAEALQGETFPSIASYIPLLHLAELHQCS